MLIEVIETPIEPWSLLQEYEQQQAQLAGRHGANVVFLGRMRDFNDDENVSEMRLEHYPQMTQRFLQGLAEQAMQQWDIMDILIQHRVGVLRPADTIVMVVVWAAHRAHAYAANQFLMEALKSRAPFWKKETLDDGRQRWVEKNTPGTVPALSEKHDHG